MDKLNAALEYLDRGWCVIPIKPDTKRPSIKWLEYQSRLPTEAEVTEWWTTWPDYEIAIVTGALSGFVVVDCDNEDALHAAYDAGMRSPVRVKTKRGMHFYFLHPRDGVRRGPRAGSNVRAIGADWPRINGLDFRGDGSYALLPPSTGYTWDVAIGHEIDDAPTWQDWKPRLYEETDLFQFEALDLSDVRPLGPDEYISEWDRTAKFVRDHFPSSLKVPTGLSNGRNGRVMRYISECILEGLYGAELRVRGYAFMREFFVDALSEPEFQATVRSMEEAEKRNHPERFDEAGDYIHKRSIPATISPSPDTPKGVSVPESAPVPRLIRMQDADRLLAASASRKFLIEPWLPPASITQVFGYSGHGKSMFVQHAMSALTAGAKYFGPFEVMQPATVLYLDFENGQRTIARRLVEMRQMHGDAQDRLQIWTPFLGMGEMNLKTKQGMLELQELVQVERPDVVVIDTIRSAFPGLQENNAEEWARINQMAIKLRNAGMAVLMLHHSGKPGEHGLGRESGSTGQLTVLETQIRVTQVYEDKETATMKVGIFDGDYERPVFPLLQGRAPEGYRVFSVMEIRYGKLREFTDEHDPVQWIGFAQNSETGDRLLVSSRSSKQKAKELALEGIIPSEIADRLHRPLITIKDWLGIE